MKGIFKVQAEEDFSAWLAERASDLAGADEDVRQANFSIHIPEIVIKNNAQHSLCTASSLQIRQIGS